MWGWGESLHTRDFLNLSNAKLLLDRIDCLRHLRDFFGVVFKIEEFVEKKEKEKEGSDSIEGQEKNEEEDEEEQVKLTPKIMMFKCLGIGLSNLARNIN